MPQASVTVTVMMLAPPTGTKQTLPSTSWTAMPLTSTATKTISSSGSLYSNPSIHISLRSQTSRVRFSGQVTTGAPLRITFASVVHDVTLPQASVAVSATTLLPSSGTKHTEPSTIFAGSPLTVRVTSIISPSGSVVSKPSRQISPKSQTAIVVLPGHVTTGALLRITLTSVAHVASLPQRSTAVSAMTFLPSTGMKQTAPSTSVAGTPLTVTVISSRSPSGSP